MPQAVKSLRIADRFFYFLVLTFDLSAPGVFTGQHQFILRVVF